MEELKPTKRMAMARFRASLLRRASAVAWVVLIIISGQAVRTQVFSDSGFWIPLSALAILLAVSTAVRWDRLMGTRVGPWISAGWLTVLTVGIGALAVVPELGTISQPILIGIAGVSGLLLAWWAHTFITVLIGVTISFVAFELGQASAISDVLAPAITVMIVAAATALVSIEFEREAVEAIEQQSEIDRQRTELERLYAVSATLARAESLSEILPHLVGTICKYLDGQVGVVLLYHAARNRLEVMSPIWVTGHPLETEPTSIKVSAPGVVAQAYRAGIPLLVKEVLESTDNHQLLRELGLKQALVAPLKVEHLRVGVIIVGDPYKGSFREEQLEQLGSLAAPAGLVLSQIGRYEAQAETARRLQEVAQMKTDFVSTVSHELRSPLTAIIASLDTVGRPELAPTEPTAQHLLSTARSSAARLQRLIDDLLVVSRIDRAAIPIRLEPVEIRMILEEVSRVTSMEAEITVDPKRLTVAADRDHLNRIMVNLVENAAKYASDSPVELYAWQREDRAVIAVVDHGPGIPEDQRDRVFERFTQIDQSDTRSKGGTGLGLSIVKSLAEVMNGSARVEDTEGGGATFVIELPLAAAMQVSE